jgi:catechol 2,3-dioxygenase-like lactoylglutathione lyase family enzyme
MGTVTIAPRSRSRELSVAVGKPMLRGIHHLALVTDDMRMTLDFYVRVLGMPIVHGLRTPSRPPGASHAHGNGAPPYANIPHYFLDMGGDSLLAFFEYPKGIAKVDRDAIGAMQHVSFACGPTRYREILESEWGHYKRGAAPSDSGAVQTTCCGVCRRNQSATMPKPQPPQRSSPPRARIASGFSPPMPVRSTTR